MRLSISSVPIAAGALLLLLSNASANPVDMGTFNQLNELPFAVVQGSTPAQRAQYVRLLAEYGVDQPLLYKKETRILLDSNFGKLKAVMLESQKVGLDYGIQARFRSQGTLADGEAMCAVLRSWLTAPSASLLPSVRVVYPPEAVTHAIESQRAIAADMLADWGDTLSLRVIEAWAADTLSAESRASFAGSASRLRNPCAVGFLVPDGRGGMRHCRQYKDLVSMKIVRPQSLSPECTKPLDQAAQLKLWSLLTRAREGKHGRWFEGGWGLHLEFSDGLIVDLNPTDSGWFNYRESGRGPQWCRVIESPTLFAAVKDCLPERPLQR
jgi:hypothetical protein